MKETFRMLRMNLLSNLFSLVGTGLILFLFGLVITGGTIGNRIVMLLSEEAQISAYFTDLTDMEKAEDLVSRIKELEGVRDAFYINATQAYGRMEKVLGEEAGILELFENNPFEAFIEIRIHMEAMDTVIEKVNALEGIDYVRDNIEVLEQMRGITQGLKILGYFIFLAVSITTLIILSHLIRQGIYHNREQIHTMKLLGAPNAFIGFPFVTVGLLLTLTGGLIASGLLVFFIDGAYGEMNGLLPFLPLPSKNELTSGIILWIPTVSAFLGISGSLFGLSSVKKVSG
ncbi:cell division protein FtsX [Mobilitalea sibirica]|uniref:cell division protein FtsX n=1 Tax=Mobilitalea sibirica TaxID=1462919 RepID=UPI0018D2FFDC